MLKQNTGLAIFYYSDLPSFFFFQMFVFNVFLKTLYFSQKNKVAKMLSDPCEICKEAVRDVFKESIT